MNFIIFLFYIVIVLFFITSSIISIFSIEKKFIINKPPSLLSPLYEIKYKVKDYTNI